MFQQNEVTLQFSCNSIFFCPEEKNIIPEKNISLKKFK